MNNTLTLTDETALTVEEVSTLEELENVVRNGLKYFLEVGRALMQIKDQRLYREDFDSFEEYCRERWGMSQSKGYYLIYSSSVVDNLGDGITLPERSSHAAPLYILQDPELQKKAWMEVLETVDEDSITGEYVRNVAHKHYVSSSNPTLGEAIKNGWATPGNAYKLCKILERFPDYYVEAAHRYGVDRDGVVDSVVLDEIRVLEYAFPEEALDILRSGFLFDGNNEIPLYQLTIRDVQAYYRKLRYEETQTKKIEVGEKQAEELEKSRPHLVIADGFDFFERAEQYRDHKAMLYVFPDGDVSIEDIAKFLNRNGYGVLFLAAYTEDEPDFNFDGKPVKPSRMNGVKPKLLTEMMKNSIVP